MSDERERIEKVHFACGHVLDLPVSPAVLEGDFRVDEAGVWHWDGPCKECLKAKLAEMEAKLAEAKGENQDLQIEHSFYRMKRAEALRQLGFSDDEIKAKLDDEDFSVADG